MRVGLDQVEQRDLVIEQLALLAAQVAPLVFVSLVRLEVADQCARHLCGALGREVVARHGDAVVVFVPSEVLVEGLLNDPGGLAGVVVPRKLPLEELHVARRLVFELMAGDRGHPQESGVRLVAEEFALRQKPADASARAIQLFERTFVRVRQLVHVPVAGFVLDELRRLGLDHEHALARREHDEVTLAHHRAEVLGEIERVDDDPVGAVENALHRVEDLALRAVGTLTRVGRDHRDHMSQFIAQAMDVAAPRSGQAVAERDARPRRRSTRMSGRSDNLLLPDDESD